MVSIDLLWAVGRRVVSVPPFSHTHKWPMLSQEGAGTPQINQDRPSEAEVARSPKALLLPQAQSAAIW